MKIKFVFILILFLSINHFFSSKDYKNLNIVKKAIKLPKPKSKNDCLLVIKIFEENISEMNYFIDYFFSVQDLNNLGQVQNSIKIEPEKDFEIRSEYYQIVQNFKPGDYRIYKRESIFRDKESADEFEPTVFNLDIRFTLKPGYITILPLSISIELLIEKPEKDQELRQKFNSNQYFSMNELNEDNYKAIIEEIKKAKNGNLWMINH